jgi:hypothetical protein
MTLIETDYEPQPGDRVVAGPHRQWAGVVHRNNTDADQLVRIILDDGLRVVYVVPDMVHVVTEREVTVYPLGRLDPEGLPPVFDGPIERADKLPPGNYTATSEDHLGRYHEGALYVSKDQPAQWACNIDCACQPFDDVLGASHPERAL